MGRANRKIAIVTGPVSFVLVIAELAHVLKSVFDPYRPELHYMRGPGPKWRAKHTVASVEAPAHPSHPALARIKG
jgi:hypothetical protein